MKPIPAGFCEAADNAAIPGRPWWICAGHVERGYWFRHDGPRVYVGDDPYPDPPSSKNHGGALRLSVPSRADAPEAIARMDAAFPLPHPGFRASQVWLVDVPEPEWRLLDGPPPRHPHVRFRQYTIANMHGDVPVLGDVYLAERVLRRGVAFLLHDPLMPSKAPWGPA